MSCEKALLCRLALLLLSCFEIVSQITWRKTTPFNKETFQLAENLRTARCSPFIIFKVLAAHIRKLITAPARKNKHTACMLANARKDHSIPLLGTEEHKQWCDYRRIFLASHSALLLVLRARLCIARAPLICLFCRLAHTVF